jgi:multicomponent Na+:H+ antiporter subunit G
MEIRFILSMIIISAGTFFLFAGSLGLLRLPDFYTRAHAVGKSDTLGVMLVILGFMVHDGFSLNTAKMAFILLFVGLTNPTATNALVQAAYKFKQLPKFPKSSSSSHKQD